MDHILLQTLSDHRLWAYGLVLFGMMVEGEMVLIAAVFLSHFGVLNLWGVLSLAAVGVATGDVMWLTVGEHLTRSHNRLAAWSVRVSQPLAPLVERHPRLALFVSKFAYGLNRVTQLRLGMSSFGWRRVWKPAVLTGLVWLAVIGGLAYAFSFSIDAMSHYLKYTEVGLLLAILMFHLLQKYFTRVLLRRWQAKKSDPKQ